MHMPVELKDRLYFSVNEVLGDTGISRQTLWRWRQDGKVPLGHRFRDRQILFDEEEFHAIRSYATHVEPLDVGARQLRLFKTGTTVAGDNAAESDQEGRN
jgi:predicted DNA-binding transcriptional regulator AlpA